LDEELRQCPRLTDSVEKLGSKSALVQSKSTELKDAFEMREQHLNFLA
jgi:hypothetical protein